MFSAVITYCQALSENAIVSSQTPALLDFLVTYTFRSQILALNQTNSTIPPFPQELPPLPDTDFKGHLITLHFLTRAVFYHSIIPAGIIRFILEATGCEWNETNYTRVITEFKQFTQSGDFALISGFEDYCRPLHISPLEMDLKNFTLSEDFRMRCVDLSDIPDEVLIWRISCAQLWNRCLKSCLHVIDLGETNHKFKTLGSLVTQLSSWVFSEVKEDALEISIRQTEYCGVDSYPVIEIDNRKVFSEMEVERWSDERSAFESECVFGQLYRAMKGVRKDVLRCKLDGKDRLIAVKMKGEQGLDWGGLYRETMERW